MKKGLVCCILLFSVACQPIASTRSWPSSPTPEGIQSKITSTPVGKGIPPSGEAAPSTQALLPFSVDLDQPFAENVDLANWSAGSLGLQDVSLPVTLSSIANARILDGLTSAERSFLSANGFVVIHTQEDQFGDIREEVADLHGQPYYLTTDASYHALHLQFDELLKSLELQQFSQMILDITQASLNEVLSYLPQTRGTSLESETLEAAAYLSVALKLLDPTASVDASVSEVVNQQIDQIMAYAGRDKSILFASFGGEFEDDYGAYRPVGHYAGVPELEQYFRGMTWYGRVNSKLADASRVPLIVTLALRRARVGEGSASDRWVTMHETLTFVVGPSDDPGPLEYAALMDAVYGDSQTVLDLAEQTLWQDFLALAEEQLSPPQINSTFVGFTADLPFEKGWRFMGQRFTLDAYIFQNLIYDKVGEMPDGTRRNFPTGLDIMSVLGSSAAAQSLVTLGATSYPNYSQQMTALQQAVQARPEEEWLNRFYDAWLYSFIPVLASKGSAYPAYMRTTAWSYRELNTALGSWAELKHDTILYTKMAEAAGGGGAPSSPPAPSYVEPNPEVFYRMAYAAGALADGLQTRLAAYPPSESVTYPDLSVYDFLEGMRELSDRFSQLGQDAADELAGIPLSDAELSEIAGCLGMIECMNEDTAYHRPESEMPAVPIVAAVSGASSSVLEVGTGYVDRILVVVPLENRWEIAQGGVYSYYEFVQPRGQRLTDEDWRLKLTGSNKPALPAWSSMFLLSGGAPANGSWILFRVGDVYNITSAGDRLYVHEEPSTTSTVLVELRAGDWVVITQGPVQNGLTWWKFEREMCQDYAHCDPASGWAAEHQGWFWRVSGP